MTKSQMRKKKPRPDSKFDLGLALCRDVEFMAEKGSGIVANEGKFCALGDHPWRLVGANLLIPTNLGLAVDIY